MNSSVLPTHKGSRALRALRSQRAETFNPEDELRKVQMMCAYVPGLVIQEFLKPNKPQLPLSKSIHGGVLFADISGFSRLAESLVSYVKDTANAAETLSNYVGKSLDRMVNTIYSRGGDVIKFAGDAIMALFPADRFEGDLAKAILCCTQVARELVSLDLKVGGEETGGAVTLKVHCGVGGGEVSVFHVGGLQGRWECVINGSPVDQIGKAEPEALPGQVVISAESYSVISSHVRGKRLKSGNFIVESIPEPIDIVEHNVPFADLIEYIEAHPTEADEIKAVLRKYIPFPAQMLVVSNQTLWNAELRFCATMFVRVRGLDFKKETELASVQKVVYLVQQCVYTFEGTFCRFIVDDKGSSFLIAFGLPPFMHENDGLRATQAALQLHSSLPKAMKQATKKSSGGLDVEMNTRLLEDDEDKPLMSCSIGVTSGRVFCGSVGGSTRCEYTMHGTSVNMAARYMVAAKGSILCGEETYKEAESVIEFADPKQIRVKGKQEKVKVYRPIRKRKIEFSQAYLHNVGRRKEKQLLRSILANYMGQPSAHRVIMISGEAGVGKTHFANHLVHEASQHNIFPIYCLGNDMEKKTPFYIFRSIFEQLLEVHESGYKRTSNLTWAQKQSLVESGLVNPLLDAKQPLTGKRKRAILQALLPGTVISDDLIAVLALVIPNLGQLLYHGAGKNFGGVGSFVGAPEGTSWDEVLAQAEETTSAANVTKEPKTTGKTFRKKKKKLDAEAELVAAELGDEFPSAFPEPTMIGSGVGFGTTGSIKPGLGSPNSSSPDFALSSSVQSAGATSPIGNALVFKGGSFSGGSFAAPSSKSDGSPIGNSVSGAGRSSSALRRTSYIGGGVGRHLRASSQVGRHQRTGSTASATGGETMSSGVLEDLLLRMVSKVSQNILSRSLNRDHKLGYKRLCIVVDGFQWVDERSMEVIGQIIAKVDKIMVVIATRNLDGTLADSRIADSSLELKAMKMYKSLQRRSWAHLIELQNFSQRDLSEAIISWTSASQVADKVVEMVYNKTNGHPWFSEEMVKLLLERKLMEVETARGQPSVCKLSRNAFNTVYGLPDTIAALLTSRLDHLPQSQLLILKVASVLGTPFQAALIAALVPFADGTGARRNQNVVRLRRRVDMDIQALVDQDILKTMEGDIMATQFFEFKNSLLREAAYNLLLFQTRRDLHGQVAKFIETRQRDYLDPYISSLAEHYYLAGNYPKARFYLEIAGEMLLAMRSMSTAHSCFQKLLSMDAKYTSHLPKSTRARWYCKLGEALLYFGNKSEAEENLNAALDMLDLNTATPQPRLLGRILPHKIKCVMELPKYRALNGGNGQLDRSNSSKSNLSVLAPPGPLPRPNGRDANGPNTWSRAGRTEELSSQSADGVSVSEEHTVESDFLVLLQAAQAYELLGEIDSDRKSPIALERRLNAMHLAYRASQLTQGAYDLPAELGRSCANLAVFFCANPKMTPLATQYAKMALDSIKRIGDGETQAYVNLRVGEYMILTGQLTRADGSLAKAIWSCKFLSLERMTFESQLLRMAMLLFNGNFASCAALAATIEMKNDSALVSCARAQVISGDFQGAKESIMKSSITSSDKLGEFLRRYELSSSISNDDLDSNDNGVLSEPEGCITVAMLCARYMEELGGVDGPEFAAFRPTRGSGSKGLLGAAKSNRNTAKRPIELHIISSCVKLLSCSAERLTRREFTDLPIGFFHTLTHVFTAMNSVYEWCDENGYDRGLQMIKEHCKYLKVVQGIVANFGKSYVICFQYAAYCKGLLRKFIGNKSSAKTKFLKCIPTPLQVSFGPNGQAPRKTRSRHLNLQLQKSSGREKLSAFLRGRSSAHESVDKETSKAQVPLTALEKTFSPYVTACAMWEYRQLVGNKGNDMLFPLDLIHSMLERCNATYECKRVKFKMSEEHASGGGAMAPTPDYVNEELYFYGSGDEHGGDSSGSDYGFDITDEEEFGITRSNQEPRPQTGGVKGTETELGKSMPSWDSNDSTQSANSNPIGRLMNVPLMPSAHGMSL